MAKALDTWHVMPHGELTQYAENLWSIEADVPDMPLKRRMTLVKRANGGVVVHSAIALEDALMTRIDSWGKVDTIVVPNGWHRLDAPMFKKRYPDAKVVCPRGSRKKVEEVVAVDADYESCDSDDSVSFEHLAGTKDAEGVLRVRSKDGVTLVFNDVLFNVPHLPGVQGFVLKLLGSTGGPKVTRIGKLFVVRKKAALKAHLTRLIADDLVRLIPGHGDVIDSNAPAVVESRRERALRLIDGPSGMRLGAVAYSGGRAMPKRWVLSVALLLGASACTGMAAVNSPGPDAPVPANEQRASLSFVVDLEPGSDCEQQFDLAVYEDRGVDLIQWDDRTGSCHGRKVTIRYLARHTSADAVRALVEKHSNRVEQVQMKKSPIRLGLSLLLAVAALAPAARQALADDEVQQPREVVLRKLPRDPTVLINVTGYEMPGSPDILNLGKRATAALERCLSDNTDAGLRVVCTQVLNDLGDRRALPTLRVAMEDWEEPVRYEVARALETMPDAASYDVLTKVYRRKDESARVKYVALSALGALGSQNAVRFSAWGAQEEAQEGRA